jgi:adenylyltransferase/sulfurtransferase
MEAIKILSGRRNAVSKGLSVFDLWENRLRQIDLKNLREETDCPTCKRNDFSWLAGREGSRSAVLCGRNSVQLTGGEAKVSLGELAERLTPLGLIAQNAYLLRFRAEGFEFTLFADGRAIIGGTDDVSVARTVYAKYVGM